MLFFLFFFFFLKKRKIKKSVILGVGERGRGVALESYVRSVWPGQQAV